MGPIHSRLGRTLILPSNYLSRLSTLSPCHPTITFLPPTYSILDIPLRQPTRARSSHRQRARCAMRSQRRTYSICAEPPTIVTFSFRAGPAHALLLVLRISLVGHKVGHCSPTLIRASCSAMENSSKSTGAYSLAAASAFRRGPQQAFNSKTSKLLFGLLPRDRRSKEDKSASSSRS